VIGPPLCCPELSRCMIRPHDDSIAKSPLASEAAAPESPHAFNTTIPRHSVHLRRSAGRRGAPAGRRRARETAAGLPVVLTRDEVRAVLGRLDGAALMAYRVYGSGLRVLEWSSSASSALLRDKPASPSGPPLTPSATRSPPTSSRTSTTSAHRDRADLHPCPQPRAVRRAEPVDGMPEA
jgi:hypothetical protein